MPVFSAYYRVRIADGKRRSPGLAPQPTAWRIGYGADNAVGLMDVVVTEPHRRQSPLAIVATVNVPGQ